MIGILRCAFVALVAVLLVGYWLSPVAGQSPPEVVISVSSTKGAPGELIQVPVYIEPKAGFESQIVELNVFWDRKVLKFKGIGTDYNTALAFANGYVEEISRMGQAYMKFTFDAPHIFVAKPKILFFLQFEVIGEKGAQSFIRIENFSLGEANVNVSIQDAIFRVLPTAVYYDERNHVEITASEVFTSFELDMAGELDYAVSEVSGWILEQSGDIVRGHSLDPDHGVTTVSIPVSEGNVVVYSLKLNDSEAVQFVERPLEPIELFVPYLVHN